MTWGRSVASRCPGRAELRCGRYGICYPKVSLEGKRSQWCQRLVTIPGIPTTHKWGHNMHQWNATWPLALWLAWLCVAFFKDIRNYVPIFKTCVMWKQMVNFNVWQLQIHQAETKNQGNRTSMGQEDFPALTDIAHWISISTFFQLLRCANLFYFSLGNFIINIVLPAIFIAQLAHAHSCFPFSFVVEALSAKVMNRTDRSTARPTATETPHCGRRPECDCRWPGPGTARWWAELSLSAQQPMGIERAVAVHQG